MKYGLLDEFAKKYKTDKSSEWHGYTRYYEFYFNNIRNDVKKVLEIGVLSGASLKMWKDYFPNAVIYGMDINESCLKYKENNIEIKIGDVNNQEFISEFYKNHANDFDIIIDDASHYPEDQIGTFVKLLPCLKSKGIYAIEDVNTSYWVNYNGGGYKNPKSAIEFFKEKIDDVMLRGFRKKKRLSYANRDFLLSNKRKVFSDHEKLIEAACFYSGLIIILKQ